MKKSRIRETLDRIDQLQKRLEVLQVQKRMMQETDNIGAAVNCEYASCTALLAKEKAEAVNLIALVSDPRRMEILADKYLRRMSWDDIAAKVGIRKPYAYILHSKAIKEIESATEEKMIE